MNQLTITGVPQATRERRRVRNGKPTNDLVFSAYAEGNDDVFRHVIGLYVAPGSIVADVTYGKGVFWRRIPENLYRLRPSDILTGVDCRDLPYMDGEIDCVVLDPPYMHSPGGTAHTVHQAFEAPLPEQPYPGTELQRNTMRQSYHSTKMLLWKRIGYYVSAAC